MKKVFREYKTDKIQSQLDKRDRNQNLWPHHPEKLLISSVEYNVKYYGATKVEDSQGDAAVKLAIQRLVYQNHSGQAAIGKPPRVYLNISADKVSIRESKLKVELDKFELSQISYVADDRAVKRVVALIVAKKTQNFDENGKPVKKHFECFLFESEKHAEEIVRTIGQAFDLSYRNFLSSEKREMQIKNQMSIMVQKIQHLEGLNKSYLDRIQLLESLLKANKITYPKSSITAKIAVPELKENVYENNSQRERDQMLLDFSSEHSSTPNKEKAASSSSKTNQVAIPSLKPPPSPSKSRSKGGEVVTPTNGVAALLDLGDNVQKTENNSYVDLAEILASHSAAERDLDQLALDRLNSETREANKDHVGSDNNYVGLQFSNDMFTHQNFEPIQPHSPNARNPFAVRETSLYADIAPLSPSSPNMPDLGSGLYLNPELTDNTAEQVDSTAQQLLDLGMDQLVFPDSSDGNVYSVPMR